MGGNSIAMFGVAAAVALSGIGSVIGVSTAIQGSMGTLSKDPSKFGKVMLMQLLPATQGLYGFIVGFMIVLFTVMAGIEVSPDTGFALLGISLPVGLVGLVSAIYQGKVCASGIQLMNKQPSTAGTAMTMGIFVEMFALLAFVVSILGVLMMDYTPYIPPVVLP